MRVLVTGNLGYVGTVAAPLLASAGHRVVGLDSRLFEGCELTPPPAVPTLSRDIREVEAPDLEGVEAVVHLAALCNDPLGELDPDLTRAINRDAAIRLGELAKRCGVRRMVLASTCSVYGAGGEAPLDERAECRPLTPYAEAKLGAEAGLLELADGEFAVTALRMATAHGASPMLRFDLVLNNLVAWANATGSVRLKSDGSAWRPLVHVEDIAGAIEAVLAAPASEVGGRVMNVGAQGQNHRVGALARTVERAVPGARVSFAEDAFADRRSYRVDFGAIAALGGFEARWDVLSGARQVLRAIERRAIPVEDFEGPRYDRLQRVLELRRRGALDDELRWVPAASPVS